MNKTFKVAKSLTRGTVVTSEKASSYQGKAVKTVIAAAVASLVAGSAMAAATTFTEVTLDAGETVTIQANNKSTVTGTVTGKDNANPAKEATFKANDVLANNAKVALNGGDLVFVGMDQTLDSIAGTGSLTVNGNKDAGATLTVTNNVATGVQSFKDFDINLGVVNDETSGQAAKVFLSGTSGQTFESGTLTTSVAETVKTGSKTGAATLESNGQLTFGTATTTTNNGTVDKAGTAYNFVIGADTTVSGVGVDLVNGLVTVNKDVDFNVTSSAAASVAKEVSFANSGLVNVSGTTVAFDADYAADKNAGKLALNGTTTLNGSITGGEVRVGSQFKKNADNTAIEDTASVLLNGATTVGQDGKIEATKLTFADGAEGLTVSGSLVAAETSVGTSGAQVSNASYTENNQTKYGTLKLGALTIENIANQSNPASLTITNNDSGNAVVIDSVTVKAATPEVKAGNTTTAATYAGTLKLQANDFEIGTLDNNGTIEIATLGKTLAITKAGDSVNAGTITGSGNVTVGEGVAFTNKGLIGYADAGAGGTQSNLGTLTVAGTLTNVNIAATTSPQADAVSGKILNVTNVVVAEGGVLDTDFVAADGKTVVYKADTTTVQEGGTFKTSLNDFFETPEKVTDDTARTALNLNGAFVLDGGSIVDRDGKAVTDYVLETSSSLTVLADNTFGNVKVSGGAFDVDDAAVKVAHLNLASGSASVLGGATLDVTKLTTAKGTLTVTDGTLSTSLEGLGLKVLNDKTIGLAGQKDQVTAKTINLTTGGTLEVTDFKGAATATTLSATGLSKLTSLLGADANAYGVIDLGNVAIDGLKANDKGRYDYDGTDVANGGLNGLKGITTDAMKTFSVEQDQFGRSVSYGNIYTGATAAANTLTIKDSAVVTLNQAADNGFLVWHVETDSKNVTTAKVSDVNIASTGKFVAAAKGTVGNVTGASGTLAVTSVADLTVDGNVNVGTLTVDGVLNQTASTADTVYAITAKSLDVAGAINAAANDLTIAADTGSESQYYNSDEKTFNSAVDTIAGTASVKNLTTNGDLLVTGELTVADTLTGSTGKTIYVGNNDAAGTLVVKTLANRTTVFTDPGFDVKPSLVVIESAGTSTPNADNEVSSSALAIAGRNSVVSLGTADKTEALAVYAKSGYVLADTPATGENKVNAFETKTVNSVLYVNGSKTYVGAAAATADTVESYQTANISSSIITVAANSMLALDANTVDATGERAVFDKYVDLDDGSILFIDNLKNGQKIKLSADGLGFNAETAFEGDLLMSLDQVRDANGNRTGVLAVEMYGKDILASAGIDSSVAGFDAAYNLFETGANVENNSKSALFNKWLYTKASSPAWQKFSDGEYDVNASTIKSIANAAGALGATTGVQTMTLDAVAQMGDTVQDRVSVLTQRGQGVNVWADVNGGKFEAKKLFKGAGYSSDIYSGVLGLDYQFSCNAVLGAALTIGTADTDSKNTAFKSSTDSDLVGFSVYASKTFADIWNVSADIGYLQASNEVKADGYGFNYKFDQDTDAFTVGVRGEVLTKAGTVNIVPHVGLRYTALSTDGFEAAYVTDIDDQNIFQMPIGVTVSADFETSGWTIAPKFDLSVVPTFGDKDADLKLGINGASVTSDYDVRVVDSNPVQAQLGVNATNGAWGFGLSYKLGVGSDERQNNSFNANVRYAF